MSSGTGTSRGPACQCNTSTFARRRATATVRLHHICASAAAGPMPAPRSTAAEAALSARWLPKKLRTEHFPATSSTRLVWASTFSTARSGPSLLANLLIPVHRSALNPHVSDGLTPGRFLDS